MKIVQKNLSAAIDKSKLSIVEIVKRMNILQEMFTPGKRPVTRSSIYAYLSGHTPTADKIYILAAVLKTHPKNIFTVNYDNSKLAKTAQLAKTLK